MSVRGAAIADAAMRLCGTPFRLHGRSPETGVDCVGLVALALRAAGHPVPDIPPYALRLAATGFIADFAACCGLREAAGAVQPGDILIARPATTRRHLLVATARDRFVHAHAGLRRVVACPGPPPWPVIARWRLPEETD
ncbi:NlpC/P60 family protein [Qipengyuania sp. JC766]|uniref:NlpC/P60 family protein n=1 Tax=Qipengyuania sp. JC766 TaxID=3232139 RepID=UPI00345A0531